MAYNKTVWINGTAPPINAENLNKIEQGIEDAHAVVPAVDGTTGQVLTKTASGTEWSDAGNPTDEQVAEAVTDWLDENITEIPETAPIVDSSLTVQGAAADAKKTGDEISDLKSAINNGYTISNYVEDKNLDSTTGALVDETGTCTSDFIPYTWTGSASYDCGDNTKLTYRIEFYDSSKNHLQGFRNPSSTGNYTYRGINAEQQVTGTVGYVRFSFKKGTTGRIFTTNTTIWVASLTVVRGLRQMIGDLDDLETTDKDSLVDAINEVKNSIPGLPITPSDTSFFYINPNLVDPSDNVVGEYVNQETGEFATNSSYTRTDYIPVEAGAEYCIINPDDYNAGIRYVFYTSAKAYISGASVNLSDIGNLVTAPATAEYIVVSGSTTRFPFMIAKSNTKISYVEYGGDYILPEYVLSEDLTDLVVNLPSKIYAVTGIETNIYYENIVENWERYNFNVSCSKGQDMKRGYKITPADTDAGSYTLSIVIYTKDWKSSKTVTTTLVIAPSSTGSGQTKSLLVLGDSTTANGTVISKLHENFADDVMSVNTVGTLGTAPNKMEGRGGWTFEFYNTLAERNGVTNPFYNSVSEEFDADYYFTQTSVTKPDWFFINLGINDMFEYVSDSSLNAKIDRCIDWCDGMIASVKSASPASKIGVCLTIPPNDSQDAFGKAYKCGQTRNRYKRNNTLWVNRMIAEYDSREAEDIYLIPIHTNLDTVYNMGMETLPVNARNAITYESPIGNGGVHPVESGYWQIADVYTAFLKANA